VIKKGSGVLRWGGCDLPSVDNHDLVQTVAVPEWDAGGLAPVMQTSQALLVCLTIRTILVWPAIGTMCQGVER